MKNETDQNGFFSLLKKGNKSSAVAAIGNVIIAVCKGFAFFVGGSGAMFASAMHSLADALNQGFVFIGSVLSEKKPTPRFPTGFGRVINIFCMIAVLVVTIMAYETIKEGWHLLQHPTGATGGFWLSVIVLIINLVIDGAILFKAMKEILHEARVENVTGLGIVGGAFKNVGRAAPPTRLVFYEDIVAVTGALLALIAILVTALTNFNLLDGIATILIGFLMMGVAFRVGYDNMVGLIGVAAPEDVEMKVIRLILSDKDVSDIKALRVLQEGRYYHVEGLVELRKGFSLADADDIKYRVKDKLIADPDITDVTLGIIEEDDIIDLVDRLIPL
ncbi:cation diffusion facilitator family transporter [Metabacillus litoralis]|jgi:cation diffusion facilitator family transporter|uniref:cation diffusion facilitator family transporter n=1 Tax=Metabacillus litoralis TaxID=152268 RepID=UPI0020417407|nr:cation diffusion facilitator family transporter [Metabacillus litoralis]MCM3654256.1 cation diffusion facilitator family transporter [Metabacillus litoralis]